MYKTKFKNPLLAIAIGAALMTERPRAYDGGTDDKVTLTKADLEKQINEAVTKATGDVNGLKAKNQELLKFQTDNKDLLDLVKKLGDKDGIAGLLDFKTKIEKDEILKLASEGKHGEAIEKATEKLKVTHSAELKTLTDKYADIESKYTAAQGQLTKLMINGAVTQEFIKTKGIEHAMDDVVMRAQQVFKIENGEVVARDKEGKLIQGEKGPLTVTEWVLGLKKSAPHFWPASEGGFGANGSNNGGGGGDDYNARMLAASEKGPAALREFHRQEAAKNKK